MTHANQGKTMLVHTSMGEVAIYNFDQKKLTAVIPTTPESCKLMYDGLTLDIDAPMQEVCECIEAKPELTKVEQIVNALAHKDMAGVQDYIWDCKSRYTGLSYKQWTFMNWSCSMRLTPKTVVITLEATVEITHMEMSPYGGSNVSSMTLDFEEDIVFRTLSAALKFNPMFYIEQASVSGCFGNSGWSCDNFCERALIFNSPNNPDGIPFFYENLTDHRATAAHRMSIKKHFENDWDNNHEVTKQKNRVIIQKMQDSARINAARIMASAVKEGLDKTARAINWKVQ